MVLIPYLQGSIQKRYYRGFTSNSSKAFVLHSGKAVLCCSSFIPYLQGSLFRLNGEGKFLQAKLS